MVDDPCGHVGRSDLDRRDLYRSAAVADGVHEPRGLKHQEANHLDANACLSDPVLEYALLGNRLAESHTAFGTFAHEVKSTLCHANQTHRMVDSTWSKTSLSDCEAAVKLA